MDAKEFIRQRNRMCQKFADSNGCCKRECPAYDLDTSCNFKDEDVNDSLVDFVEQWAKENPVKTNFDKLKETFPGADFIDITSYGVSQCTLLRCPQNKNCVSCKMRGFWEQEYIG